MNAVISMVLRIYGLLVVAFVALYMATAVVGRNAWTGFIFGIAEVVLVTVTIMFTVKTANEAVTRSIERRMQTKVRKV